MQATGVRRFRSKCTRAQDDTAERRTRLVRWLKWRTARMRVDTLLFVRNFFSSHTSRLLIVSVRRDIISYTGYTFLASDKRENLDDSVIVWSTFNVTQTFQVIDEQGARGDNRRDKYNIQHTPSCMLVCNFIGKCKTNQVLSSENERRNLRT